MERTSDICLKFIPECSGTSQEKSYMGVKGRIGGLRIDRSLESS